MNWLSDWPINPLVVDGVLIAALLYSRAYRRRLWGPDGIGLVKAMRRRARAVAFYSGLLAILLALDTPIDALASQLLWVHMVQHLLLMMVAAPLIVYSAPWLLPIRALPARTRGPVTGSVLRGSWARPIRRVGSFVAQPMTAWVLFNVNMLAWHVPWMYDQTLRHAVVHDTEHLLFLFLGILFWAQVVDSPPLRGRLGPMGRALYLTAAGLVGLGLSMFLALAHGPLYVPYAELVIRPGGISALTDQQLGAGVMWGPGSIAYGIGVFYWLYRWMDKEGADALVPMSASGSQQ